MSTLINDLADVDDEVFLFLEDYHWISNQEIHDALAFFLRHAPSNCHVVLTTRTEPPLPLASLRAQNILLEIDAPALRFNVEEIREFVEAEGPGTLGPSDAKLLRDKTDGWSAALRIVTSTSVQLNQDSPSMYAISRASSVPLVPTSGNCSMACLAIWFSLCFVPPYSAGCASAMQGCDRREFRSGMV